MTITAPTPSLAPASAGDLRTPDGHSPVDLVASGLIQPSGIVIAHSVTADGDEVVTFEAWIHRFVLAEWNTHRVIVKSSASSRAIPIAKQIEMLRNNVAYPVRWPREKRGMQGGESLDEEGAVLARNQWTRLLQKALETAAELRELGLHKSVSNRLLEPWMFHKVVMTASAWENFFRQRDDEAAQPEVQAAAKAMRASLDLSKPTLLGEGDFHLPYISDNDRDNVVFRAAKKREDDQIAVSAHQHGVERTLARASAARCARTSYLTNPRVDADGTVIEEARISLDKDFTLYNDLVSEEPRHWSPLEHPCTPWAANKQTAANGVPPLTFEVPGQHGNRVQYTAETEHLPRVGPIYGYRTLRTEVETLLGDVTFR